MDDQRKIDLIKRYYTVKQLKPVFDENSIAGYRSSGIKKENLIKKLLSKNVELDKFDKIPQSELELSDDDDDDDIDELMDNADNINQNNDRHIEQSEPDEGVSPHFFNVSIWSPTMNADYGYHKFRRSLIGDAVNFACSLNKLITSEIQNKSNLHVDTDNSFTTYTVCGHAPKKIKYKQMPKETDPKYKKKRNAAVRGINVAIEDRIVNAVEEIGGGAIFSMADTWIMSEGSTRKIPVTFIGSTANADNNTKIPVQDKIKLCYDNAVQKQKDERENGSKTISIVKDIRKEVEELENQFENGEIDELNYYKMKSKLMDKQLLMIDGKRSEEKENEIADDEDEEDDDDDDECEEENGDQHQGDISMMEMFD